jgi:serine O-acetyltransferase
VSLQDALLRASRNRVVGRIAYLALKSLGVEFPRSVEWTGPIELAHGAVGLVVHSRTRIGAGVTLMPGVVLGRSDSWNPETPQTATGRIVVGDRVTVGAGAKVLFKSGQELVLGEGTIVGANTVLLESTGPDEIWAGNPARRVGSRSP